MKVRLEYIKDTIGNNYVGVNIYQETTYPYLNQLEEILDDEFETYRKCQIDRDHGKFHITVINPMEYNRLCKEYGMDKVVNTLEKYFEMEFDVTLMGLGKASRNENTAYFVVVNSDELAEIRKIFKLPIQDFHITLAFKFRDVFGVRKNEVLSLSDPFLKHFKKYYYNDNESFNFLRNLNNFDSDDTLDVEPIKIEDTYATLRVGKNDYYTVSLINNELVISAKWSDNVDKPILPNTIVYKKMK